MAQATLRHSGDTIDYKPTSASLAAGDVVVAGSMIGIAAKAIPVNTTGALHVKGVFAVVKDASTIAVFDRIYWNPTGDPVGGTAGTGAFTTTEAGGVFAGVAVSAAATGVASFDLRLNPTRSHFRLSSATAAAAGSTNADATVIGEGFTLVTAADGTKGVKLPAPSPGAICVVKNGAAAILKVYPGTGKKINGGTATTGALSMAANTSCVFVAYDTTDWYTAPLLPS